MYIAAINRPRSFAPLRLLRGLGLGLLLSCCAACGGPHLGAPSPAASASTSLAALARPAALLPPAPLRQVSYADSDLTKVAAGYESLLPYSAVSSAGNTCNFFPNFSSTGGLQNAAYCCYRFSISGYDRNAEIEYAWDLPPASGKLYLALGNWDLNRWDWFKPDPAAPLRLNSLAPYLRADGSLLITVVCLGMTPCTLDWLHIGSQPPLVYVTPSKTTGVPPYDVSFDASASYDPDGSIAKFEWDLDGDGLYEHDSGLTPNAQTSVTAPGIVHARLRVTDNDGVKVVVDTPLRAFGEWVHSWGGSQLDQLNACAYDGENAVYFCGQTISFGNGGADVLLLKYDLAGNLVWAHTWGSSDTDQGTALTIDADGNVLVAGFTIQPGYASFVLKLKPDGSLIWARRVNGPDLPTVNALVAYGTDIYAGGRYDTFNPNQDDYSFMLKLDKEGQLQWLKGYTGMANRIEDFKLHASLFGEPDVFACGSSGNYALYLRLGLDGAVEQQGQWGNSNHVNAATSISVSGITIPEVWLGGLQQQSGLDKTYALLLQYSPSGAVTNEEWNAGKHDSIYNLLPRNDGGFYMCGNSDDTNPASDGLVLGFDAGQAFELGALLVPANERIYLDGKAQLLSGNALLSCGLVTQGASGSNWAPTSGFLYSESETWQSSNLSAVDLQPTYSAAEAVGALTTPGSAVLDSGGGSEDGLAVLHLLP